MIKLFYTLCFTLISSFFISQEYDDINSILLKYDETSKKYGLVNLSNQWLIPPQFKSLQKLNSYFYYGEIEDDGKYYYRLDLAKKTLIKIIYKIENPEIYFNKYIIFYSYHKGPKGVMDIYGKEILPAFYTNIEVKENYFIGRINQDFYIYDLVGNKILPDSFKYIEVENGYIYTKTTDSRFSSKEKFSVYNKDKKLITQEDWNIEGKFGKDGLLLIKNLEGETFYINQKSEIVIKPNAKISYTDPFSNGLAIVSSKEKPVKYGFINTSGKITIPLVYDEVAPFQTNYAYFLKKEKGKEIEGLINRENSVIKVFPAKVVSKSIYYDQNNITYYLSNLETYDADGNFLEDRNLIQ